MFCLGVYLVLETWLLKFYPEYKSYFVLSCCCRLLLFLLFFMFSFVLCVWSSIYFERVVLFVYFHCEMIFCVNSFPVSRDFLFKYIFFLLVLTVAWYITLVCRQLPFSGHSYFVLQVVCWCFIFLLYSFTICSMFSVWLKLSFY